MSIATPSSLLTEPRIREAVEEMQALIRRRYPEAIFELGLGEEPVGVYLRVIVDVEETNDVIDVYIDRMVDLHVDEELPLHVIPVRPPEQSEALLRERAARVPVISATGTSS